MSVAVAVIAVLSGAALIIAEVLQPAKSDGFSVITGMDSARFQPGTREYLLERVARWTLTDMWRPPADILSKGGSPRRQADPQNISTHLRLMRLEYERTGDPLFLAVPLKSVLAGFGPGSHAFGTRTTGLVFNYLPWYLEMLSKAGGPAPDAALVVRGPESNVVLTPGGKAKVCFAVRNSGAEAVSGLRVSFQPRLDFSAAALAEPPEEIAAGGAAEFCYEIQAPQQINLTCEYNRIAYGHWSAAYRRQGAPHVAHAWVRFELRPPKIPVKGYQPVGMSAFSTNNQ